LQLPQIRIDAVGERPGAQVLGQHGGGAQQPQPASPATKYLNGSRQWAELPPGNPGTVTQVATGPGLTGGPINGAGTISLDLTGGAIGSYSLSNAGPGTWAARGSTTFDTYGGFDGDGGPITNTHTITLYQRIA
jgi:hypothetical protein